MKNQFEKSLGNLPIESWPIVGALAYASDFSPPILDKLLKSESFTWQLENFSLGKEISEFMLIASQIELRDLKDVEGIFEGSLETDVKKAQGAVYTPDFIIDYILDETVTSGNIPTPDHPVLDPACGSGGFLVRAAKKISLLTGDDFATSSKSLCGSDINPKAVANAKLLLDLACLAESGVISNARFYVGDSLLLDIKEQFSNLRIKEGVSALVTNPPYVKLQNLDHDYSNSLVKKYPQVASGAFSLASLFLYNAVNYLVPNGKAGFITLNNVFTSLSGKNLRKYWSEQRTIEKIVDFRHYTIFDASAYTCLIFLDKNSKSFFSYNAVSEMPSYNYLKELKASSIDYEKLNDEKWRLGDASSLKLISAMENVGVPLKSIAEIRVGFATLRDKAFVGTYVDGKPSLIGGDGLIREVEQESVIDFFKVSEFSGEGDLQDFLRPIIYPYVRQLSARPLIPLDDFANEYPMAYEHLNSWKNELLSRGYVETDQWHEWGRRQSLISNGPKLLTKTFDIRPNFRLDLTDSLFCNGYSVKPKDVLEPYDIGHLKTFLESRFFHAYSLVTSFEIAGGFQCYQKNFIENVCLPPKELIYVPEGDIEAFENKLCKFYGTNIPELNQIISHYGL